MRSTRHLPPTLLFLLLALLSSIQPAAACSCVYVPDQDHACVAFPHADAVFSGRVASVSERTDAEIWGGRYRVFHFEVLEGFSGVEGTTVEVATGMGGGDCGFDFEAGRSYLVYARRLENGNLSTSICSRTRPLEKAAADLDHARRVVRGEPQVALFGKVEHVQRAGMDSRPSWDALKGIPVTAEGPDGKRVSAISGEDGRFEIRQRLSGPYTVRAAVSEGLPAAASQELPPRLVEHKVSGQVRWHDDQPAAGVQVRSSVPTAGRGLRS